MLRLILAAACLLAAPAAYAQLPGPLEQALSAAPGDAVSAERIALRMTVNGEAILVEILPGGENRETAYTLLQPASEDALSEAQAEMWAGFNRDDEEDAPDSDPGESYSVGQFDAEGLREAIGASATLLREENGRLVYGFTPQSLPGQGGEDEERSGLLDNLAGEIEVDAERGQIAQVRFALTESFKPNMAARINDFLLEQRFVHEPAIDGPRFAGMTMSMAGSAVFQSFSQTMEIDLVSVRYAGAGPLEAGAESP
jgi:hypothetical protein